MVLVQVDHFLPYHLLTPGHIRDLLDKLLLQENAKRHRIRNPGGILRAIWPEPEEPSTTLHRIHLDWDAGLLDNLVQHPFLIFDKGYSVSGGVRGRHVVNELISKLNRLEAPQECLPDPSYDTAARVSSQSGVLQVQCVQTIKK